MENNVIKRIWNQNKMVNIEALQGMAFQAEDGGHTFEISGVDDSGNPVALSGTVAGVFVRPDNADIALSGTASDGKVYVTLSDACYAVPGKFGLTIFVTSNSKKTAVYAAIGTVNRTSGGAVAGDTPQDVVDLINAINTAVATIPASYTNLLAAVAPNYSNSSLYAVGSYVWYDGALYRCTTNITTAESWTAAHWIAVALGDDVSELNRAVSKNTINIWDEKWELGTIAGDGTKNKSVQTSLLSLNFIPCEPSTQYYIYSGDDSVSVRIAQYKSNGTFIGMLPFTRNTVFTTDSLAAYLLFYTTSPYTSYANNISINKLVGDYRNYYPYLSFVECLDNKIESVDNRIDGLYQETPNLWDEEIISHYYLNNEGTISPSSTDSWCTKNAVEVLPSTEYYISSADGYSCRVAQYDVNGDFISFIGYVANSIFTTSSTTKFIRFWKGGSDTYDSGVAIYLASSGQKSYLPHKSLIDYVARDRASNNEYIIVGEGQEYTTVVAGFAAAIAQDKGCIILPGTYDLVSEGVSSGTGITAPKHVIGYGAKIIASLPLENWDYSAINISKSMDETIIEGLEIEVTNCRYCVHDEEYDRAGYYHHVFKNCKMKHNSSASATLIRPICIGGGFGNKCLVEIENCDFYSHDANNNDVNYHANALGQSGDCIVKCKDSIFETSIGLTGNMQTGFVNKMYVCGCLCGSVPVDFETANSKLTQWNNAVRSD